MGNNLDFSNFQQEQISRGEQIEKAWGGQQYDIEKSRTKQGVYANTAENRKKGIVGKPYDKKQVEDKRTSFESKFTDILNSDDDDKQERFYDAVAKYAGEPDDDGESESSLLKRLGNLSSEKQQKILDYVNKK